MPRQPDPDLQERILNAAQKLWKKGAEKTLTMRAVAKAAGTNTTAVYRRFRNREDILRAAARTRSPNAIVSIARGNLRALSRPRVESRART
jgi:AcrR family transcriptional regulator